MTTTQKTACRMLDDANLGAIITKYGWTWKETCRRNEDAAAEVVRVLANRK